jgi:hypothetical protein
MDGLETVSSRRTIAMARRWILTCAGILILGVGLGSAAPARAENLQMDRGFYYPYYYFPHNYWPSQGPKWPETPGAPYQKPPAYMAYPPFHEPSWRYELWQPQRYYRGFHFWLDQF